jgi:hypothetical protein
MTLVGDGAGLGTAQFTLCHSWKTTVGKPTSKEVKDTGTLSIKLTFRSKPVHCYMIHRKKKRSQTHNYTCKNLGGGCHVYSRVLASFLLSLFPPAYQHATYSPPCLSGDAYVQLATSTAD